MNLGGHDDNVAALQDRFAHAQVVRYYDNHLDTIRRCASKARTEYIWVIASSCDYTNFDFEYHAVPWEAYQIHCWASDSQRFGDTFLINVAEFIRQQDIELLEWYKDINWHSNGVSRLPWPIHKYTTDNLVKEIQQHVFASAYTQFTNDITDTGAVCLWTNKQRTVERINTSGSCSLVPRDIKQHLKTQIYDYPYLNIKASVESQNLDIVYISNGEPEEEKYYNIACQTSQRKVKWVRGINGRTAAYQAAANASDTDWFFTVFAKLEVNSEFNWHWQPDYWQVPKHYIFNARNPVNGLEYGHMGMIAYNKRLVLENNNPGIDFTLSQPHESVPLLSGTAHFNQDAWTTWRTAFREVVKLRLFMDTQPTLETEHRLNTWLTRAQGNYSNYCLDGAKDAVEYYESVKGDPAQLQLSFEWAWLRARYDAKY
jgi:hypothetical protein